VCVCELGPGPDTSMDQIDLIVPSQILFCDTQLSMMLFTVPLLTVPWKLAVTNVLITNSHANISEPVAVTELAKT